MLVPLIEKFKKNQDIQMFHRASFTLQCLENQNKVIFAKKRSKVYTKYPLATKSRILLPFFKLHVSNIICNFLPCKTHTKNILEKVLKIS